MNHKWADVFRDWHDDLIWWVRHGVPKLVVILVLAFVLIRLLEIVTRKLVELSKRSTTGAVRVPQIRTLAGSGSRLARDGPAC